MILITTIPQGQKTFKTKSLTDCSSPGINKCVYFADTGMKRESADGDAVQQRTNGVNTNGVTAIFMFFDRRLHLGTPVKKIVLFRQNPSKSVKIMASVGTFFKSVKK